MAIRIGSEEIQDMGGGIAAVYAGESKVWPVFVPYLEIEPQILWVNPWGTNDVLSNTDWIIDNT